MKTPKFVSKLTVLLFVLLGFAGLSLATPVIDSLTVQGYMKKADGTAVTNGTYNLVFGVRQNGSTIWAKQISTTITNGLFSASLSGLGTNLTGLGAGTGMNSDFSAVTLNPALLHAGGSGGIVARVYASSTINGANPQFDISINSTPTSFVSALAQSVASGSVGLSGIASIAKTNVSTGASDAGKIILLNASGVLDDTMFPSTLPVLNGSNLTNVAASTATTATTATTANSVAAGSVTTAGIAAGSKTNASAGAADAGKITLLNASGKIDNTMFPAVLPAVDGSALTNIAATSVAAGAITLTEIAAGSKTNASAGAGDAGKLVLLNGSGKLADTLFPSTLPALNGSNLTNVAALTATSATSATTATTATTASTANAVAAGAVTTAGIAAGSKTDTSAGAGDAGKIALLNSSGKIDSTFIPATLPAVDGSALTNVVASSANAVAAGSVTTAGIAAGSKTNASSGAAEAGKLVLLNASGLVDPTMITGLTLGQGGTGQSSAIVQGGVIFGSTTAAMGSTAVGTSGQVLTSAGTGTPTWSTVTQAARRSQVYMFEDFLSLSVAPAISASAMVGTSLWTAAAATGTVVTQLAVGAAGDLGKLQVATSTTAANIFLGFCGIPSAVGTPVFNSRFETADPWTFEIRFQVSSIAANTGFTRFGLLGAMAVGASTPATPLGSVVGSYIEQTNGAATMSAYTKNAGSSGGSIVTQSSTTAATFERWTVSYDGVSTLTFSKNGASFTTLNTAANIPTATAVCPGIQIVPGTVARNVIIDYISFQQGTSSR